MRWNLPGKAIALFGIVCLTALFAMSALPESAIAANQNGADSQKAPEHSSSEYPANASLPTAWETPEEMAAELLAHGEQRDAGEAEPQPVDVSDSMTGKALKRIPKDKGLSTFSLVENQAAPDLEKDKKRAVKKAIRKITDADYDCGFVFLDLMSGTGVAYNTEATFYTASSFKAPFVLFILKQDGDLKMTDDDRDNAEAAIKYSDNDAYDELSIPRLGEKFTAWLKHYGIAYDDEAPSYPTASTRSMARVWADIFQYLRSDAADAKWFSKLLASTTRSYVRDAVSGKDVEIRNKAGWIADEDCSATVDCAYIDDAGHPYLLAILTDQPDSDKAAKRVTELAKALYATR